jgi:hypothetical protein
VIVIVIGLLIVFWVLKRRRRENERSSDLMFQEFHLEEDDQAVNITAWSEDAESNFGNEALTMTQTLNDSDSPFLLMD